jgi:hypothetical protein
MLYDRFVWVVTRLVLAKASLARRELGQGIMEYAILLGAIALVAAVGLYAADFDFTDMRTEIQDCISFDDQCG